VTYAPLGGRFEIDETAACAICGAPAAGFKEYNGRPKAICGKCGAAERQRVLAQLYRDFIRHEHTLEDKRIFHVGPDAAEVRFLKALAPAHYLSVDARPNLRVMRIADICAMPEIATDSYDAVVASGVLSCVHDLEAALGEIHRVLIEGGTFLHCEVNYGFNSFSEDAPPEQAAAWYGQEALEKFRVGLFRRLGDLDFIARLQKRFVVKTYYGRDAVNGLAVVWHCAIKRTEAFRIAGNAPESNVATPVRFATTLPDGFPARRITIDYSVPQVPDALKNTYFAGHHGDEIFLTGKSVIGHSRDAGATFEVIRPKGLERIEFEQCFVTASGNRVVQSVGWRGAREKRPSADEWGKVFVFDTDWNVIGESKNGDSPWHGAWSIDEADGVMMYAEYPDNAWIPGQHRPHSDTAPGGPEFNRPARVMRSWDGGLGWEPVFELPPGQIRHFHTLLADPFQRGQWWLTSGDLPEHCRVWRSADDGDSWQEVTATGGALDGIPGDPAQRQACQRLTAMQVRQDDLLWVGDDLMAPYFSVGEEDMRLRRTGAWVFVSPKTAPLAPRPVAYLGQVGRSLTDVGPGYIVTTEAKKSTTTLSPQLFFVAKEDPARTVPLLSLPNFAATGTGFSYSRASRMARDGVFFTYRMPNDGFANQRPCVMRWRITFD
jgi:SAM-dependent methyltransferase